MRDSDSESLVLFTAACASQIKLRRRSQLPGSFLIRNCSESGSSVGVEMPMLRCRFFRPVLVAATAVLVAAAAPSIILVVVVVVLAVVAAVLASCARFALSSVVQRLNPSSVGMPCTTFFWYFRVVPPLPLQGLHWCLCLPCSQMLLPPQGLHRCLCLPCSQMPLPPQSLHLFLRLLCGHF
jgi:hypothetical protein